MMNLVTHFNYWKLVYWKLGVKSLRVGLVTLYGASNAVNWGMLSGWERFVIVGTSIVAVLDVWDSFFDQTINQIKSQTENNKQQTT